MARNCLKNSKVLQGYDLQRNQYLLKRLYRTEGKIQRANKIIMQSYIKCYYKVSTKNVRAKVLGFALQTVTQNLYHKLYF